MTYKEFLHYFLRIYSSSLMSRKIHALNKAIYTGNLNAVDKLCKLGVCLDKYDKMGNTSLHYAVFSNNPEIIQCLLETKPYLENKNKLLQTPLMLTCEVCSSKTPYYSLFTTLKDDNTIRKENSFKIFKMLADAGADIHTKDKNETTPIIKATLKENEFIVQYLLEQGISIYQSDKKNGTAAVYAIECQNETLINMLIKQMDYEAFNNFISYIKSISSIVSKDTIEQISLMKNLINCQQIKSTLENNLRNKANRIKRIKI